TSFQKYCTKNCIFNFYILGTFNCKFHIRFLLLTFFEVDERFNQFKAAMSKHLKTIHSKRLNQDFEDCFTGTAAVNVLTKLFSLTRQEAELLGQQFMDQGKIIHHSYR